MDNLEELIQLSEIDVDTSAMFQELTQNERRRRLLVDKAYTEFSIGEYHFEGKNLIVGSTEASPVAVIIAVVGVNITLLT